MRSALPSAERLGPPAAQRDISPASYLRTTPTSFSPPLPAFPLPALSPPRQQAAIDWEPGQQVAVTTTIWKDGQDNQNEAIPSPAPQSTA
jgi:hypothetical protein